MKHKQDHHYTMLVGVFVLVVLAAAIIFMTQFNAQVGEAGRLIKFDNTKLNEISDVRIGDTSKPELQKPIQSIVVVGEIKKPSIGGSAWEEAEKKGMLVDPGYGLPDIDIFGGINNIIIINEDDDKPKLILYDPRWHDDLIDIFKPRPAQPSTPKPPVPPSLEELGRIIKSPNGYTCYYDENGNFVRAWRMSRVGNNVEIDEDPDGRHKCPKTVQVKKIEPALPPPIVSESDNTNTKN
jgi:hypothetical protein